MINYLKMIRKGIASLPLHTGKAPAWLFRKMKELSQKIVYIIVIEFGRGELLRRLSDPYWFQSFGCILGFDWHSSGLTTTVCGALKEALRELSDELKIYVCGGKGKTSRKTPQEIEIISQKLGIEPKSLIYASKMTAKIDNNCLQDSYNLYHHTFIFTDDKKWCVIQQGMNSQKLARRYHWISESLESFICEPHAGIITAKNIEGLNLVACECQELRKVLPQISSRTPFKTIKEIESLKEIKLPFRHRILLEDINPKNLEKILLKTYLYPPKDFEELVAKEGVGPKTLRALALVSEIIYGAPLSFKDPAKFSFAHGGKDKIPYPIDKASYQASIDILEKAIKKAKLGYTDKLKALRRLYNFYQKK